MKRRTFLAASGFAAVAAMKTTSFHALAEKVRLTHPHSEKLGWKISVQHWVYRRVPMFEGLAMAAEVGLRCFEPRTILALDAKRPGVKVDENMADDARKELKSRASDLGISFPSVFADFDGSPDQAKRLLEFSKDLGVTDVVCEPPTRSFDMLEPLFDQYGMKLAVHNHQRTKSDYWHPSIVLDYTAKRGKHLGACCDVGQWTRSDLAPVDCLRKIGLDRMISFHLKDVVTKGDLECPNTVAGEGAADCVNCLQEIHQLGYQALVTIDFELDTPKLQEDMLRNIAFIETQASMIVSSK